MKCKLNLKSRTYEGALKEGKKKMGHFGICNTKWKKYQGTFHYNSNDAWMELK